MLRTTRLGIVLLVGLAAAAGCGLGGLEAPAPVLHPPSSVAAVEARVAGAPADADVRDPRADVPKVDGLGGAVSPARDRDPPREPVTVEPREPVTMALREVSRAEPPPDPIEGGEAELELLLFDRRTGEAVDSLLELWRLDAPANADWTRGDQLHESSRTVHGRASFRGLPVGRYRAFVHAVRAGADDPGEFLVLGPKTRVELWADARRGQRAFLVLVDENGRRVSQAAEVGRGSDITASPTLPDWSRRRTSRRGGHGGDSQPLRGTMTGRRSCGAPRPLVEGPHGFELENLLTDSRTERRTTTVSVRGPGGSWVDCVASGADPPDSVHVGVTIDPDFVLREVLVPGLGDARSIGARVRITSRAVLLTPDSPAEPWRHIPIRVSVQHADYEPLEYEFSLADGVPPARQLVAREP